MNIEKTAEHLANVVVAREMVQDAIDETFTSKEAGLKDILAKPEVQRALLGTGIGGLGGGLVGWLSSDDRKKAAKRALMGLLLGGAAGGGLGYATSQMQRTPGQPGAAELTEQQSVLSRVQEFSKIPKHKRTPEMVAQHAADLNTLGSMAEEYGLEAPPLDASETDWLETARSLTPFMTVPELSVLGNPNSRWRHANLPGGVAEYVLGRPLGAIAEKVPWLGDALIKRELLTPRSERMRIVGGGSLPIEKALIDEGIIKEPGQKGKQQKGVQTVSDVPSKRLEIAKDYQDKLQRLKARMRKAPAPTQEAPGVGWAHTRQSTKDTIRAAGEARVQKARGRGFNLWPGSTQEQYVRRQGKEQELLRQIQRLSDQKMLPARGETGKVVPPAPEPTKPITKAEYKAQKAQAKQDALNKLLGANKRQARIGDLRKRRGPQWAQGTGKLLRAGTSLLWPLLFGGMEVARHKATQNQNAILGD